MFQVNNEDIRRTSLTSSAVEFEQVNGSTRTASKELVSVSLLMALNKYLRINSLLKYMTCFCII